MVRCIAHGTSVAHVQKILDRGLCPRSRRKGNWKDHPSVPNHVYLTAAYGLHFGKSAARVKDRACALVEIDLEALDPKRLMPDEDAVSQYLQTREKGRYGSNLREVTEFARNNIKLLRGTFDHEFSLRVLGNCAHDGVIPRDAIKRIVILNEVHTMHYLGLHDPTISLLNYMIRGQHYEETQAMFLGREYDRSAFGNGFPLTEEQERQLDRTLSFIEQNREIIYDRETVV